MPTTSTRVLALALAVVALSVADARGDGLPSVFRPGARVDANATGEAVVAWRGPAGVRAAIGDRAGGFGPVAPLSAATNTPSFSPQVAIDDRGDAIVVWETYRESGGGECSTCPPRLVSDGVWASLRRAGASFGPPVALAGPQPDAGGADYQLTEPRLAMSSTGQAIVAWSDAAGAVAAFRAPGGAFGAPQRVLPAGFAVAVGGAAIAGDGQALLADGTGRVAVRPAGGAFGPPELLPESAIPYGPGALLAANAAGDALAAYRGARGVLVSRRPAGGGWSAPALLTPVAGASARAVAISDAGAGVVTFVQIDRDPRLGGRSSLFAAVLGDDLRPAFEQVGAAGFDADMAFDGAGLDLDTAGGAAIAFHRADGLLAPGVAQLAQRPPAGPLAFVGTLTSPGARQQANGDAADVAFGAGDVLATWVDHYSGHDRVVARWIGSAAVGALTTLDSAAASDVVFPVASGHAAQLTTQRHRTPDRYGRIRVGLRCLSIDRRPCTGTLRLVAGPTRWNAGRRRFAIAPGVATRIRVTLSTRARRALRKRGRITLTAHAATTAPGGTFGATRGPIVVNARR